MGVSGLGTVSSGYPDRSSILKTQAHTLGYAITILRHYFDDSGRRVSGFRVAVRASALRDFRFWVAP